MNVTYEVDSRDQSWIIVRKEQEEGQRPVYHDIGFGQTYTEGWENQAYYLAQVLNETEQRNQELENQICQLRGGAELHIIGSKGLAERANQNGARIGALAHVIESLKEQLAERKAGQTILERANHIQNETIQALRARIEVLEADRNGQILVDANVLARIEALEDVLQPAIEAQLEVK